MFKKLIFLSLLPVLSQAAPQFEIEAVDRAAKGNRVVQLMIRPDGSQHLVYTGCSDTACNDSELFYANRSGNSDWTTTSVDNSGDDTGWFPSISFNDSGIPHIFYADHYKQKLWYATLNGGSWKKSQIGSGRGGWWTSSVAANGKVYMAHTKLPKSGWENAALEVGTLENGKWTFETVDAARNAGWFTSAAILPDGNPVISYNAVFNQPVGAIKIAYKKNNKWQIVDIDDISIKHHVTVDKQGFLHVVYQKVSPISSDKFPDGLHDLMYATNAPNGNWHREKLQEGGTGNVADTGTFPRITVDAKGGLHMAYIINRQNLAYARKPTASSAWEYTTIDEMGASIYPWIETDSQGQVHIAWEKSGRVMYALCKDCAL